MKQIKSAERFIFFGLLLIQSQVFWPMESPPDSQDSNEQIEVNYLMPEFLPDTSDEVRLLFNSAVTGDLAGVEAAVARQANVNARDRYGATVLHYAVGHGHLRVIDFLLNNGCNVHAQNENKQTALHLSVSSEDTSAMALLISHNAEINCEDEERETPLHYAARGGYLKALTFLLKRGANSNARTARGMTPLHYAASNDNEEIVSALLEARAQIDAVDSDGWNPLHYVAATDNVHLAELLRAAGALVESGKRKPLHVAAHHGRALMVRWLLEHGALSTSRMNGSGGRTALHIASNLGHVGVVQALIERKADVNAITGYQKITPLHTAVAAGNVEIVKLLVEHGAEIEARGRSCGTPITLRTDGSLKVIPLLLRYGASLENINALVFAHIEDALDLNRLWLSIVFDDRICDAYEHFSSEELHTGLLFAIGQRKIDEIDNIIDALLKKEATSFDDVLEHTQKLIMLNAGKRKTDYELIKKILQERSQEPNQRSQLAQNWFYDEELPEIDRQLLDSIDCGDVSVVIKALQAGPVLMRANRIGRTPLHYAVLKGNYDIVRELLMRIPSKQAAVFNTVLHAAAARGFVSFLELLLDNGFDVKASDDQLRTSLHYAATRSHAEVVRLLLKRGADVYATDDSGETPLHCAAAKGPVDVVRDLLASRAEVNALTTNKNTPLHVAAAAGQREIVQLLLSRGAQVNATNKGEETPLHVLINGRSRDASIVAILLNAGALINTPAQSGLRPLHAAVHHEKYEMCRALLERGADIRARDKLKHWTPLMIALRSNAISIIKLLLMYGAEVGNEVQDGELQEFSLEDSSLYLTIGLGLNEVDHAEILHASSETLKQALMIAIGQGLDRMVQLFIPILLEKRALRFVQDDVLERIQKLLGRDNSGLVQRYQSIRDMVCRMLDEYKILSSLVYRSVLFEYLMNSEERIVCAISEILRYLRLMALTDREKEVLNGLHEIFQKEGDTNVLIRDACGILFSHLADRHVVGRERVAYQSLARTLERPLLRWELDSADEATRQRMVRRHLVARTFFGELNRDILNHIFKFLR